MNDKTEISRLAFRLGSVSFYRWNAFFKSDEEALKFGRELAEKYDFPDEWSKKDRQLFIESFANGFLLEWKKKKEKLNKELEKDWKETP